MVQKKKWNALVYVVKVLVFCVKWNFRKTFSKVGKQLEQNVVRKQGTEALAFVDLIESDFLGRQTSLSVRIL